MSVIAIDANLLVYAVDGAAGARHRVPAALIERLGRARTSFIPLQAVGEFYNVAVRKLGLSPAEARHFPERLLTVFGNEPYGAGDIHEASIAVEQHGLSFWDALIWAVCERVGCEILATEDLQDGRRLGRVTFLNPFERGNAPRLGLA